MAQYDATVKAYKERIDEWTAKKGEDQVQVDLTKVRTEREATQEEGTGAIGHDDPEGSEVARKKQRKQSAEPGPATGPVEQSSASGQNRPAETAAEQIDPRTADVPEIVLLDDVPRAPDGVMDVETAVANLPDLARPGTATDPDASSSNPGLATDLGSISNVISLLEERTWKTCEKKGVKVKRKTCLDENDGFVGKTKSEMHNLSVMVVERAYRRYDFEVTENILMRLQQF